MKRATIDVHIEQLELPAGTDPAEARRHLELELGQMLRRGGVPADWQSDRADEVLAGSIVHDGRQSSAELGRQVAGAVHSGAKR